MLRLDGPEGPEPPIGDDGRQQASAFSPDGRWIAHMSNESGEDEIYVRPFPNVDDGKWMISSQGGGRPTWSGDGREIVYEEYASDRLVSVEVELEPTFSPPRPQPLPIERNSVAVIGQHYDTDPNGERFLSLRDANSGDATRRHLVVVLN